MFEGPNGFLQFTISTTSENQTTEIITRNEPQYWWNV